MQSEETPAEKATTIKVPPTLKDALDTLKQDDQETYAGVISRLIHAPPDLETGPDTVVISLPRRVYHMVLMLLPNNMGEVLRKGVR
ncbi:MAG: hypothetical protein LUQ50_12255 [Methanospirillum sp.]|uniref:hypothetical protein n=1 Tax=Methanospirillum sp. TaxID=45200 RepID=UPI00236D6A18|nr:hypothetical protein [Methanospirillum sp.]MDD1729829.1 hypothetical protein [Methanospirillum sp.]